ncbi:MAG: ABATE domain-containing protein, partial [Actinomycetes bacterium]
MQEPAHVELLREFANTLDAEDGSDELTSPSALDGWLRRAGLLGPRRRSTQADLRTALD